MIDTEYFRHITWAVLMVDEAHCLKNIDSDLYKMLLKYVSSHRLLITGTPLQNSLQELHFIMPGKFASWNDFAAMHQNATEKGYARLHEQLESYILRRVKKDVEKTLPIKVEQIVRVKMTSTQKRCHDSISNKNFDKSCPKTFIELRKCSQHTFLIEDESVKNGFSDNDEKVKMLLDGSGKLTYLDKLLKQLHTSGHRVLVKTFFKFFF